MTKTQASKNKAAKKSSVNDGCGSTSIDEVKSIFDTLNKCKKLDASSNKLIVTKEKNRNTNRNTQKNVTSLEVEPTRKKDGLYHEPELSLKMSDSSFFDGVDDQEEQEITSKQKGKLLRNKRARGKAKNATSDNNGDNIVNGTDANVLRNEGVDRIVSMRELQKMLSHNPKAGTTPNCPFDCDCCF